MTLSSMVVSRDWQEVSILECILGSLRIDVTVEREPQRALTRLSKSKIDALIVDCDLDGTNHFLREIQRQPSRAIKTPLLVMSAPNSRAELNAADALFAFEKPISVEQAVRTLSAARNLILDGRLRYHREGLEVPVTIRGSHRARIDGHLINVSQGGLQIYTDDAVDSTQPLRVFFELPGAKHALKAEAEIAWQDQRGNVGFRFVKLAQNQQRSLRLWLAQQYFAN